ncbi:hypothetical protein ACAG39_07535 [Caldicellulosiruptoraceae bacterium PP1]
MRLIKFIYKLMLFIALFISVVFVSDQLGFSLLSVDKIKGYEYFTTIHPKYEINDAARIEEGILLISKNNIGIFANNNIDWYKLNLERFRLFTNTKIAVIQDLDKNVLHVIKGNKLFDLTYTLKISKLSVNKYGFILILTDNKDNYILTYDNNLKLTLHLSVREDIVDADFNNKKIVAILRTKDQDQKSYISFIDRRGIYKSKELDEKFIRSYLIEDHLLCMDRKGQIMEIDQFIKPQKTYIKVKQQLEYLDGSYLLFNSLGQALIFNQITDSFTTKQIEHFDKLILNQENIILINSSNAYLFSKMLNKIKKIDDNLYNVKKIIIINDKIYYIYNNRIEVMKERIGL